ncbi:sulfatase [Desulfofundulus kuznetsovii DSM 6115]|uniref:Sulfatase n=1 Tax=Desulfofundulus kuznetsovii (strain DSM 6115 / VKM B-1805 / 17) TaxID=760568 RepID=A0AAU8PC86_DESK7|nr:sulfatase [Desulfofundulus kuznetsovii DSM 6115]
MPKKLPNIVLIVLDTARAKNFCCYGYVRQTFPRLRSLIERGWLHLVKWCFSTSPWTLPSHASIWTGLYPHEHGVVCGNFLLPGNTPLLPQLLKAAGYRTYGFSTNFLVSRQFGFADSFDVWWEARRTLLPEADSRVFNSRFSQLCYYLRHGNIEELFRKVVNYTWRVIHGDVIKDATPFTRKILIWTLRILRDSRSWSQPCFVFVNLMQAHERYNPPPQVRGTFSNGSNRYEDIVPLSGFVHYVKEPISQAGFQVLTDLYDEELLYLDIQLSEFFYNLKLTGASENTVVLITSDHGELLGEHNHYEHLFTVYNEVIHVPLLLHFPSWIGLPRSDFVQLTDIYGTISDIVGSPLPVPSSSLSLFSNEQRAFAIAQFTDLNLRLMGCEKYNPDWRWNKNMLGNEACIIDRDTMIKATIKTGKKLVIYDLKKDYDEEAPTDLPYPDGVNELPEHVRGKIKWLAEYIDSLEVKILS